MTLTLNHLYNESIARDEAMRTMLAAWIRANTSPYKKGADLPIPTPVKHWLKDELVARIAYESEG